MADETITEDIGDDVEVEAKPGGKGLPGKRLVLFVVAPILLLLLAGGGAYFMGLFGSASPDGGGETGEEGSMKPAIFYDLPEMLVNLNSGGRTSSFLKISVSLEIESESDRKRIDKALPRVIDNFQIYLRELRIEDLSGSAGMQRLREELLLRVNAAVRPTVVKDVLFKEMLVQ